MDNAGPHQDKPLNEYLDKEFKQRNWQRKNQPPNSPLTNVMDACVFPSLSKLVTQEQAKTNNSCELDTEDIWNCAKKAYERIEETTIARSFVTHSQIVAAIVSYNGGDGFARESNGLHCGIRRHSVPFFSVGNDKPVGVSIVTQLGAAVTDELERTGLKYPVPDVDDYFLSAESMVSCLQQSELHTIYENLPVSDPLADVVEQAWNMVQDDDDEQSEGGADAVEYDEEEVQLEIYLEN
jgi:hypothetical protein